MNWSIAHAKQRFSEVVRESANAPQMVYNRDRLTAVVVSADDFAFLQDAKSKATKQASLWDISQPLRDAMALEGDDGLLLEGERWPDRPNAFLEMLEADDHHEGNNAKAAGDAA
jgi:PHD/YefM family antitoxin component YafN of YafNO toxin-antitoxin module